MTPKEMIKRLNRGLSPYPRRDGSPGSWTPVGPARQAIAACRRGPWWDNGKGSRREETFEARCPGFPSDCLRFAGWVAPPPRKTRFRLLASSTGRDLDPQGSNGRFPSCSHYISSPFPRLCLAQCPLFLHQPAKKGQAPFSYKKCS